MGSRQRPRPNVASADSLTRLVALFSDRPTKINQANADGFYTLNQIADQLQMERKKLYDLLAKKFKAGRVERIRVEGPGTTYAYRLK